MKAGTNFTETLRMVSIDIVKTRFYIPTQFLLIQPGKKNQDIQLCTHLDKKLLFQASTILLVLLRSQDIEDHISFTDILFRRHNYVRNDSIAVVRPTNAQQ